jgi:hypothetical protein
MLNPVQYNKLQYFTGTQSHHSANPTLIIWPGKCRKTNNEVENFWIHPKKV